MGKIVTFNCIMCGKPRTDYISRFYGVIRENYKCAHCKPKFRMKRDKVTWACVSCGKKRVGYLSEFKRHDIETYKCHRCATTQLCGQKHPSYKIGKISQPCRDCGEMKTAHPNYFERFPDGYRCKPCSFIDKTSSLHRSLSQSGKTIPMETRIKISMFSQGVTKQEEWGGFACKQSYCGLWTPEVKERNRSFFDYKCAICGKDEVGFAKKLDCHHVYWQKSSCCELDDETGLKYFNIGVEQYYYIGDPVKFVPLCPKCHGFVKGNDIKSKIDWVVFLENVIMTAHNGKSFFTKEDYWGNGYYSGNKFVDAITGDIYGKTLRGFTSYGHPKKTLVNTH